MRIRFVLGLSAVLAIAIGSVLGAILVRSKENSAFERRQEDEAIRAAHQAEASAELSVGQLATAATFYQAVDRLSSHKFHLLANSLLGSGALVATAFVEAVPAARRREFERRHGFAILERSQPPLGLTRAKPRAFHYPLVFLATRERLEPPPGYDVAADPIRAPYLRLARDRARPVASRVVHLVIGGTGINVFVPVFRDGAPLETVAERRSALAGFAAGSFDIKKLAQAAGSALDEDVDLQLLEGGRSVLGRPLPLQDSATMPVRIADRAWLLVVRDPRRPAITLPLLIAVFGISMAALLGSLVVAWNRGDRMRELQRQASQDALTGLKNRRRFEEDLRRELARSRREGTEGALLILDLDNFKRINDTHGHPVGDRVIAGIAGVLGARMRETDVVARLGGDEFALVLPGCDPERALAVANEIAQAVRDHRLGEDGIPNLTASIGVAMFGPRRQGDFERVLTEADAAMYEAKQSGRDAVRISTPEAVPEPQDPTRGELEESL